jgi:hypothetical protein
MGALTLVPDSAHAQRGGGRMGGWIVVAPRGVVATRPMAVPPFRFARPFFVFRPRFGLGLGLWVGFPVAYPYPYAYSYG